MEQGWARASPLKSRQAGVWKGEFRREEAGVRMQELGVRMKSLATMGEG